MSPTPDAPLHAAEEAYQRLAEATPDAFKGLALQQGVALTRLLLAHRRADPGQRAESEAMVARVEAAVREMTGSPNAWIGREAARQLVALAAVRAEH